MLFKKWILALWHSLVHIGIDQKVAVSDARYIKTLNVTVLAVFLASVPYSITYYFLNIFAYHWIFPILGTVVLLYPSIFYLNAKRYYLLSKILFLVLGFFHLTLLGVLLDPKSGLDLYILISFMLPWFLFKPQEFRFIVASEILLYLLYIFIQYYLQKQGPVLQVEESTLNTFRWINLNLIVLYLVTQGHYIYRITHAAEQELQNQKEQTEELLLNILPKPVAEKLKIEGAVEPIYYEAVTVLFTDFVGFTKIAEKMNPRELIAELDFCFRAFDEITETYGLEKLKTIGDAYMCAGGLPVPSPNHAEKTVLAALKMRDFIVEYSKKRKAQDKPIWKIRIGIHSGPLVAGVVGYKKFAYDVWGDTVNTASRMESAGLPNEVNISESTYRLVRQKFRCMPRPLKRAKDKPHISMYLVKKPLFS